MGLASVEFESPDPAAASPPGACPRDGRSPKDGPHPLAELGAVAARWGASSFSPAVPPACHKQRHEGSPVVTHGHSERAVELSAGP
jgi:hypothetical protein